MNVTRPKCIERDFSPNNKVAKFQFTRECIVDNHPMLQESLPS